VVVAATTNPLGRVILAAVAMVEALVAVTATVKVMMLRESVAQALEDTLVVNLTAMVNKVPVLLVLTLPLANNLEDILVVVVLTALMVVYNKEVVYNLVATATPLVNKVAVATFHHLVNNQVVMVANPVVATFHHLVNNQVVMVANPVVATFHHLANNQVVMVANLVAIAMEANPVVMEVNPVVTCFLAMTAAIRVVLATNKEGETP